MPDFFELKLCEKIGNVLAYAVEKRKYNRYELISKWLASETYNATLLFDVSLASQAKTYILNAFEQEFIDKLPAKDEESYLYADDVYWFGYTMAYWFFMNGISGKDILKHIDIGKTLDEYDVLHTISVKHAIAKIKEDNLL